MAVGGAPAAHRAPTLLAQSTLRLFSSQIYHQSHIAAQRHRFLALHTAVPRLALHMPRVSIITQQTNAPVQQQRVPLELDSVPSGSSFHSTITPESHEVVQALRHVRIAKATPEASWAAYSRWSVVRGLCSQWLHCKVLSRVIPSWATQSPARPNCSA